MGSWSLWNTTTNSFSWCLLGLGVDMKRKAQSFLPLLARVSHRGSPAPMAEGDGEDGTPTGILRRKRKAGAGDPNSEAGEVEVFEWVKARASVWPWEGLCHLRLSLVCRLRCRLFPATTNSSLQVKVHTYMDAGALTVGKAANLLPWLPNQIELFISTVYHFVTRPLPFNWHWVFSYVAGTHLEIPALMELTLWWEKQTIRKINK